MSKEVKAKAYMAEEADCVDCIVCGQTIVPELHYYRWAQCAGSEVRIHCDCANPTLLPKDLEVVEGNGDGETEKESYEAKRKGRRGDNATELQQKIAAMKGSGDKGAGEGEGEGEGGEDRPVMWSEFEPAMKLVEDEFKATNTRIDKAAEQFAWLGKEHKALAADFKKLQESQKQLEDAGTTRVLEIVDKSRDRKVTLDATHFKFEEVFELVQAGVHVYLFGDKGGGKSTLAKQIALALDLPFGYISLNPLSSASRLEGFMNASGQFVDTEFHRIYTGGGVFCIDELDNAAANVLTAINGAVANEIGAFAHKNEPMHPNFILIGTGNTALRGATPEYPERRKGDESVMDRMAFVHMPYDRALEKKLALQLNPNAKDWVVWVQKVRAFAEKADSGIRGLFATPRAVIFGARVLRRGKHSVAQVADSFVFKGIGESMKDKIIKACPLPTADMTYTVPALDIGGE